MYKFSKEYGAQIYSAQKTAMTMGGTLFLDRLISSAVGVWLSRGRGGRIV